MARLSEELIEEIKSSNDIVDVISQYMNLKRSGRNYFGLCPFHNEKSPSFAVSPDKQIYHCFGCGVGGNVFRFVGEIEGLSFMETVKMLADRANITIPDIHNAEDDKKSKMQAKIYEINEIVAEFYHENLYNPSSKMAQDYIKQRKLDNKTLKTFKIGYAGNFDETYKLLKSKGYTEEEILESGLANKTENGKYIDRFRKRLMFPLQDVRGKFIGFGGRVLDDSKPKYINSSENLVYSKGRQLYGLNIAKKFDTKKLIIVEGYMDAISLYQRGITNAVASLGTALTDKQGWLLRKTCEQVIIGYDSDGAGQEATLRGMEILQKMGCDLRVLQLEAGAKDPDEYIIKYGPERFLKCIEKSISLVEFKVKTLKQNIDLNNINDKIKFLNQIAQIIATVDNIMEREIYIDKIAIEYNVSKEAIIAEVTKLTSNIQNKNILNKPVKKYERKEQINQETEVIDEATLKREKMIIYILINYEKTVYNSVKDNIALELFKSTMNRQIIEKLYDLIEKGNSTNNIIDYFEDEQTINYLSEIMTYDFQIGDVKKCVDDLLVVYTKTKYVDLRNQILKQLDDKSLNQDKISELENALSNVIIKLSKLK